MKSHYDVLELEKNCSQEEIKDSYLRLSKKYHPDVNNSSDAHKKFVQVNEAYSVLGKAKSKQEYDERMAGTHSNRTKVWSSRGNVEYMTYAEYLHKMNMKKNYQPGVDPFPAVFKIRGMVCCVVLMIVGTALHFKYAWDLKNYRNRQSQETSMLLAQARSRAHQIGYQQALLNFANGNKMKNIEEDLKKN